MIDYIRNPLLNNPVLPVEIDKQSVDDIRQTITRLVHDSANRARKIGVLRNVYLITTKGGGDSEYLEFYYNFNAKWKTRGKCKIYSKQFGEFVPGSYAGF